MEDAELVLRFFALRNIANFTGKLETFLDLYMMKSYQFSPNDIDFLKNQFLETIEVAHQIYGDNMFTPYNAKKNILYKAYYDAVMVGINNHLSNAPLLIERQSEIIKATEELLKGENYGLFTGQGKTQEDLRNRIEFFSKMSQKCINQ